MNLEQARRNMIEQQIRTWDVLDLDILLWSEGAFEAPGLCIPHIAFADRRFVLDPLARIAADWRDPRSGLTIYHLKARLDRKRPAA